MAEKRLNVFNEFTVTNLDVASYCVYAGARVTKCETGPLGTTWTLIGIPEFDIPIIEAEANDPKTCVTLHDYLASHHCAEATQGIARRNCGLFVDKKGWGKKEKAA